jgi:CPA2 family monovalent cation:H+ antiporter-2
MAHLPHLIADLALILAAAAAITLLFKWLKQPLVLGYIIAGFLVGPYFHWLPTVTETGNITIWAEIGVIFLLFSLGLEFSFKKLIKVGGPASITAIVEVVVMIAIGYGVGAALGWNRMDSLFLGGILSISSTTIIIRAFDELGFKTRKFAALVFGVLIVEDLVAIVLMVLLSTVAVSRQFAGMEMIYSILKLLFFLVIWFLMGIFLVPTFLRRIKNIVSNEMLLIISLALCLLMVVFANAVGFSPALGAFIMGSILAETTKAEKIEHLITPVKDLFGAIFFVSVGMLIDPSVLLQYAFPILILCLATIAGKILSTTAGALLSGQPLNTSVQAGFSLAQIGEFSFIIATLGLTLNVTSDFLYPIAVAVSAVTTLTTPYLIRSSQPFNLWLHKKLPAGMIAGLNRYASTTSRASKTSEWRQFLRSSLLSMVLLCVVIVSVVVFTSIYVKPWLEQNNNPGWAKALTCLLTLAVLSPFLWALAIKTPAQTYSVVSNPSFKGIVAVTRWVRLALTAFVIGFLLHRFFDIYTGIFFTAIIIVLLIIFSRRIQLFYHRLETRFLRNLNQRELEDDRLNRSELAPWDARIVPVKIAYDAPCVGRSLLELQWRELAGINVVMIKRGDQQVPVPGKEAVIFPGDELLVLGTDHQVQRLKALLRPKEEQVYRGDTQVELFEIAIASYPFLATKTIRESGLREKASALIVGLQRGQERILNPSSETVIEPGDILFVVSNREKLRQLKTNYV